ncbi:MAG: hypothetical protein ACREDR_02695 [Blastocatellia bacterium]
MFDPEIDELLKACVEQRGIDEVISYLQRFKNQQTPEEHVLTIIANAGIHQISSEYLHGEVYIASQGNIDFSSREIIQREYEAILRRLSAKLRETHWAKIYLVPTGHPTLAMQIKLFVCHILRIDTTDIFYSKGKYAEISIDYRHVILATGGG